MKLKNEIEIYQHNITTTMNQPVKYTDLNDFLSKHKSSDPTHTRIGSKELNIYGGSFHIPTEVEPQFWELYYDAVFLKRKMEYLTEKQLGDDNSPILIDFDFRYNYDVSSRQHNKEHIVDIILLYLEILKEFFLFKKDTPFPVYVFEKPNVNRLEDKEVTKDGIHIIIGIKMNPVLQQMLRNKVLAKIEETWELPIINSWDSVLDEGISKGVTNWQVFGSRKPGNMAYNLTQLYSIEYDEADGEFMMEEKNPLKDFNMKNELYKLSARYRDNIAFQMNPSIHSEYEAAILQKSVKKSKPRSAAKVKLLVANNNEDDEDDGVISLNDIKNKEQLEKAMNSILKDLDLSEYNLKEIHEYTQILPEKYYEAGSHLPNRLVAFALKHTDERLFLSWVMLRSKASDFSYDTIPELYENWKKHFKVKENGITKRSIMYWAKQDAPEDYLNVKNNTIEHYIDETISNPTDYDFAMVLFQMFKDKYICTNLTNKTWYKFKNHHWERDLGRSLGLAISREMYKLYMDKMQRCQAEYMPPNVNNDEEKTEKMKKMVFKICEISNKLKQSSSKGNILREAEAIFYDEEFNKKMDENRYLLCFTNGVVDLKNKVFRDGLPEDYITKTTGIPYVELNETHNESIEKIRLFMSQLFPVADLNKYMWQHLASVLIGENKNQTFNIYRGNGSNGKSLLTDLMTMTLGEYAGTVPVTLITEKRVNIGGTSSEIAQLKGIRYAVMQEPSKDARINEGIMKQLTGDSTIQARALYSEAESFAIQFHLVVCTNTLFEIVSNDDGTWRRIRICEFMSKFVNSDDVQPDDTEYVFPKNQDLKELLPSWAPIFASLLVDIAFEKQGNVESCPIVMSASNKYRQGQDHIAGFVNEKVFKKIGARIKKTEITDEFKKWFCESQGNSKAPKGKELCEYMDKKFGKCQKDGWRNVQLLYPDKTDELDDLDEE
jgi:P4 family phage/plasmid primase-like protien